MGNKKHSAWLSVWGVSARRQESEDIGGRIQGLVLIWPTPARRNTHALIIAFELLGTTQDELGAGSTR